MNNETNKELFVILGIASMSTEMVINNLSRYSKWLEYTFNSVELFGIYLFYDFCEL